MTDTATIAPVANEIGKAGRPLSSAQRRARLRMHYIHAIGLDNITPVISESILAAVELTVMAAETRKRITKSGASSEDLLALVRLENSAARAVARLDIPAKPGAFVIPEAISTVAA